MLDLLSRLQRGTDKKTILVIVDSLTTLGRLKLMGLETKVKKIWEEMRRWTLETFGKTPKMVIKDQGTQFTGVYWQANLPAEGTEARMLCLRHSETDG
jgi:hypothetical protein